MNTSDLIHIASAGDAEAIAQVRVAALPYLDQAYDEGVLGGYWLSSIKGPEEEKENFIDPECVAMAGSYPFLYLRANVADEGDIAAVLARLEEFGFVVAF